MWRETKVFLALGALLAATACAVPVGEEPLYVLRDSLGRSVAMAGRSQLGDAAPGTMVRASIGGAEQELMVGERIGMGPVVMAQAAPAAEPATFTPASQPVISTAPLAAPPPEPSATSAAAAGRSTRSTRGATAAREPRRAGPPPRSVSRSVM